LASCSCKLINTIEKKTINRKHIESKQGSYTHKPTKRILKKKKLQHRLKENKTLNPKHIKMNKKENRVRNLPKHSNFTCEIKP